MKENIASRTAQYMALFRAIETYKPADERLFADPFAIHFLDKGLQLAAKFSAVPVIGKLIPQIIHHKGPGALTSGIARTKFIDTLLEETVKKGSQQVLILGAGFDTRAMRLPFLKNIPVIEIDHPATSNFKRNCLQTAQQPLPANVKYLQIDFNQQRLADLAKTHQLNGGLPTTIIWEGVTNYLTQEAVDSTFDFLSCFPDGSFVIFTYIDNLVLTSPQSFVGTRPLFDNLKKNHEEWTLGFAPAELAQYLRRFKLTLLEDLGAEDYRKRFMGHKANDAQGYEFYRVAFAQRTEGIH